MKLDYLVIPEKNLLNGEVKCITVLTTPFKLQAELVQIAESIAKIYSQSEVSVVVSVTEQEDVRNENVHLAAFTAFYLGENTYFSCIAKKDGEIVIEKEKALSQGKVLFLMNPETTFSIEEIFDFLALKDAKPVGIVNINFNF